MKTETSIVARQYRLLEWAEQIRDCKARPSGMSVAEWCMSTFHKSYTKCYLPLAGQYI